MNFSVEFPDLQKSREITAVLQKVSILGIESLFAVAFLAWLCIKPCKKQTYLFNLGVNRISLDLEILHRN